ncbi:hypothetical protein CQY20_12235 [Mycolicibacterium agri]|uniref:Uncharacterized protein n=1 Tax=Mycolicibacterium agri TaxID=36811 RepID=A0A2A7N4P3_MYCAG|nr:SH3 domain-containing protein [Mycolicibacterium agri]PEG38733.1 hypothetical protein CQY20_12235 [Mycolicibacterium agri]GFG53419.1 hypothetical protein MAGR_48600 [Mycolicibacterium agri]
MYIREIADSAVSFTASRRKAILSIAVASSAIGALSLLAPPPAQALPRCNQFGFPGDVLLRQTNGWSVAFSSTGTTASGPAHATGDSGATMDGTVSGSIFKNRRVNLVIKWNGGPTGEYTGQVGDDYHISGDTAGGGTQSKFRSVFPISCLIPAAAEPPLEGPLPAEPAPAPPPPPRAPLPPDSMSKSVVVNQDTDVYNIPDGDNGTVIGVLDGGEGQRVGLYGCDENGWCRISFKDGPNGKGFVWGEHLERPGQ